MRRVVVIATCAALSSCSDFTQLGKADFCFVTEEQLADEPDDGRLFVDRTVQRRGLTRIEEPEFPDLFEQCAFGMRERAEFVDEDGGRFWLGVTAQFGARELLPPGILRVVNQGTLSIRELGGGFTPVQKTLFLATNTEQPIIALQSEARD